MSNDCPAIAAAEERRLAALHALGLLDSPCEHEFDAVVALAAQLIGTPITMLTLVDRDRLYPLARHGAAMAGDLPRAQSFCDAAIAGDEVLVVEDGLADMRFARNPLVYGDHGVRFYAGVPIRTRSEQGGLHKVGTICVLDHQPRTLSPAQEDALRHLACVAEALIAARAAAREAVSIATTAHAQAVQLRRNALTFRQAERLAKIGSWRFDLVRDQLTWSDGVYAIHHMPADEPVTIERALAFYPPASRAAVAGTLGRAVEAGEPFDVEADFITTKGELRRVRTIGEVEREGDLSVAVTGVFQDITREHALAERLRHLADIDDLTQIANRAAFNRTLDAAVAHARALGTPLGLLLVDLDDFKAINDTHGHLVGDDVLRATGDRLRLPWLRGSFAARLGGDEFGIIVTDPALCANIEPLAEQLAVALTDPVETKLGALPTAASIGFARLAPDHQAVRDFVHAADNRLYAAKRARPGLRDRRSA